MFEPEIVNAGVSHCIPSYASISESTFYVIEEQEKAYNEMMQGIGLHELGVLESTGDMVVYEGSDGESLKDRIVNFLKKCWETVREAIDRLLMAIKRALTNFSAKFTAFKIKNSKDIDWDKAMKKKLEIKSYEYPYMGLDLVSDMINTVKNYSGEITKDYVLEKERREEKTYGMQEVKDGFDTYYNVVSNANVTGAAIKNAYKAAKKDFDEELKKAKKADNSDKDEIKAIKNRIHNLSVYYTTVTSVYYEYVSLCIRLVSSVAKFSLKALNNNVKAKAEAKKTTQESATYQSEIATLFDDWSI